MTFQELFGLIRRLHREGLAVLLVEQNVGQSLEIADRAYVLENGALRFQGRDADAMAAVLALRGRPIIRGIRRRSPGTSGYWFPICPAMASPARR